jgi:cation diffusion facilitator CzcD-associated flavoprotein CzcO
MIAIVGAGFGGIATAVQLARRGIEDFVVFEQSDAPGGVWLDNTYPGCEVDINSLIYSFSFMPYDWARTHAPREELQRYAEDTIDRFGIRDRFRFGVAVVSVEWEDSSSAYRVTLADGTEHRAEVVVAAPGFLSRPRYPEWPGLDAFQGPTLHTARWEHEHDLTGKRVALVGTGSSGVQVTSRLAQDVGHLYVFQREPGWIVPKRSKNYAPRTRRRRRRWPSTQKLERAWQWLVLDVGLRNAWKVGSPQNRLLERYCRRYIAKSVRDPELRTLVTPGYPFGCKRPIFDDSYFDALQRPNVTLVPHAVKRVTASGIVAADDRERTVDAIVMATGFRAQEYLSSLRVRGRGGRDLHEVWGDSPTAFLGLTVPDFPNFFIVYGPNTNGGNSIIFQIERQANAIARMIARLGSSRGLIDTRRGAFDRFVGWVDAENRKRTDAPNFCHNYYRSPSGRNVTQWPRGSVDYWILTNALPRLAMRLDRPVV